MHDEDTFLSAKQKELSLTDPALAYQIYMQCNDFNHFTPRHLKNLHKIFKLPGFSGNFSCGVHITEPSLPAPMTPVTPPSSTSDAVTTMVEDNEVDLEADLEEEQAGEDEEQAVLVAYSTILEFTYDG